MTLEEAIEQFITLGEKDPIEIARKLRAQCCDISGLTKRQLDEHARHVEAVVLEARKRRAKRAA